MSEITSEQLAAALAGGFVAEKELNGWVDVSAEGAVAAIAFTPIRHEPGKDNVQHFRAVVVEGETVPDLTELRTEVDRLTVRLQVAEAVMRKALTEVEHEEAVYQLRRYFAAAEAAQAEQERAQ